MTSKHKAPGKAGFFARMTRRYVLFSHARPWVPLLVIALTVIAAALLARNLRVENNYRVLLPDGTPSKVAIEEAERRKGSTDLYTVAFEAPDIEAVARFQKDLADSLRKWPEAVWVEYDQDPAFFERHALLYLPVSQLEDLRGRVSAMINGKFAEANPLISSLFDEEEEESRAPANLDGWPDEEELRAEGLPQDLVVALTKKVKKPGTEVAEPDTGAPIPEKPDSLSARLMNWHAAKKVWVGVVLVQLDKPSTNAQFARAMFDRGEALIASMNPARYDAAFNAKVAGAYRNSKEIDQLTADAAIAGIVSGALILLLLWFFVRKIVSVGLIFMPLLVGMAWAMGITYVVYERLTLLTMFILSLILGLGIEYAVHLYARWAEESRKLKNPAEAMVRAMTTTGRSLLAGAATNIFAMLSLQIGRFEGFREYGVVVSIGILCALIANWVAMPPVFFLVLRGAGWLGRRSPAGLKWVLRHLLPSSSSGVQGGLLVPYLPLTPRVLKYLGWGAAVFTLLIAFGPMVKFENDFRNLRGKDTGAGISYGRAVGGGKNTSPAIIIGDSEAQMRSVHDSLVARHGNPADSMLTSFLTIQSFVPSREDQAERLAKMAEIRELLDGRAVERADSSTRADLDTLRKYLGAQAFGFDSLPGWSKRFLTEADGSHGKLGFLYAKMRESDAVESGKFKDRFLHVASEDGPVQVASSGFIYADIVRMVKRDGPILALATLAFLLLITAIDMRNWRGVVVVMGFVILSSFWTYKLMGLFGLKLGMYNLVVIPTILSVSVDSVIHLYHRRLALGAGKMRELYHTTGSAVLTGTLTNMFGFLGLCFVDHKGMQSIGLLATLGICSGILVMFTALPGALELLCPKEPVAGEDD